jgi:fumarate reductase subunit D
MVWLSILNLLVSSWRANYTFLMIWVTSSLVLICLSLYSVLRMVVHRLRSSRLQSICVASLIYSVRLITSVRTVTSLIGLLSR